MQPKVALAMIVKGTDNELPYLISCLRSVKNHVDGIFIDVNAPKGKTPSKKIIAFAEEMGADVKETVWEGNFVKARNENFARVPEEYDWILWLDADDTVENPEKIREVCAIATSADGLFIKYEYDHDEYGNVIVEHWNARLVKNNGSHAWKASFSDGKTTVHETLNEKRKVVKVANNEFCVVHHSDNDRRDQSLERNITLLEGMLGGSKNPDPRILYYLATHYLDAGRTEDSRKLFVQYLELSGWAEERAQAWTYLGRIYNRYGKPDLARGAFMRAVAENPRDPLPYVELGELELQEKLFEKAVTWLVMATEKKTELTSIVQTPMEATYRAYKLLSEAYANIGGSKLKDALEWLEKAIKMRPFDPELQNAREMLEQLTSIKDLTEATQTIVKKLRENEKEKIVPFLNSLPTALQDNPLVTSTRNYYATPKKWADKSVVIVCGWGLLGNWGPQNLETGLGGSEEAVIQMGKQLRKLGYSVTVFGTPGDQAGVDSDGIDWRHYWEFNRSDEFDIVISWREPAFYDQMFTARKSYLWLHDVMDKEEFTEQRLKNLDRIIFVSKYHRELYPFIEDSKCFISGNGIVPEDFSSLDGKFKRDPHRVVYMSSHLRGLQILYEVWEDVKKAVPDATLDVYYGWGSFDAGNKSNPERMAWKQMMVDWEKKLNGVTDHGKVGHRQIATEIQKSGVWAYPCPFPEVYCITGVKAQAGGAVPVSSDFAALKETVQHGTLITMKQHDENTPVGKWEKQDIIDAFRDALITMLKDTKKQEEIRKVMMPWARAEMSWEKTARGWHDDFSS